MRDFERKSEFPTIHIWQSHRFRPFFNKATSSIKSKYQDFCDKLKYDNYLPLGVKMEFRDKTSRLCDGRQFVGLKTVLNYHNRNTGTIRSQNMQILAFKNIFVFQVFFLLRNIIKALYRLYFEIIWTYEYVSIYSDLFLFQQPSPTLSYIY